MSMISRLLNGASSAQASNRKPSLESNVDTQYSYNLLFPDPELLCHNDQVFPLSSATFLPPAALSAFDVNPDVDLEVKDVRVIIMQEAAFSASPYLLYDSHPAPPATPPVDRSPMFNGPTHATREGRRSISSPRKGSLGQISKPIILQEPSSGTFSAFGRRPTHSRTPSLAETEGQRSQREHQEEIDRFSACIFGSSEISSYKGTGTKFHILPSEHKPAFTSGSYAGDGSFGRSSLRGTSKLSQSYTSSDVPGPTSAAFTNSSNSLRATERKRVVLTRMFPVPLPTEDTDESIQDRTPTGQTLKADETGGYPFPLVENGGHTESKKIQPKQKKTPMYAVSIIVTLPPSPVPQVHTSRSSFKGPSSYTEQDSTASSFNSTKRAGWTVLDHFQGVESISSAPSSEVEDRIDLITQHWDIINRTLSHLQSISTSELLPLLKRADISSPDPRRESFTHHRTPSVSISIAGKRVAEEPKPMKPSKTNAKPVSLTENCLAGNQKIQAEVLTSRERIIGGLRANRVVTSQGRWGIWREEARLVNKWSGGRDEGFFFFNLLTGFLGNHTEWLQHLGPHAYRRRRYQQQRANKDGDISLPARTVIVADNKIMARRLIFLLAAFLPATQPLPQSRFHRPSTSTSFGGYSQSPPGANHLKADSLRRRINKRSPSIGAKNAHSRTMSFPNAPTGRGPLDIYHHERRPSDAHSLRTANLPIPGSELGTRKSSTATVSTGTSVTTMPHFSTRRLAGGTGPTVRPGSSGSIATDDLKRSLKRDSSSHLSHVSIDSVGPNSRWGSMISGFWSSKRRDSSASTSVEPLTAIDNLSIKDSRSRDVSPKRSSKLEQMVDEVNDGLRVETAQQRERDTRRSDGSATTAKPDEETVDDTTPRTIPRPEHAYDPNSAYQSPVKTSINVHDGVIDIDIPMPDFLSFDTAVSSPSSSGYMSTPGLGNGLEGFEHYSRAGPDADTTMNVGGWLSQYHPDFALHALPSSAASNIVNQVKESMRAEPTPLLPFTTPQLSSDRWVDISSAVIADTTNFSIKHILYRRLVRVKEPSRNQQAAASLPNSFDSRYGNVYSSAYLTPGPEIQDGVIEEKFIEEPIISLDETLVEAIERIIAQSGQVSAEGSASSSRASSRQRKDPSGPKAGNNTKPASIPSSSREGSRSRLKHPPTSNPVTGSAHLEVPRNECKRMILGALEEIVKEVVEGRKEGGATGGGSSVDGARQRGLERGESFLREGVRIWLEGVEAGF